LPGELMRWEIEWIFAERADKTTRYCGWDLSKVEDGEERRGPEESGEGRRKRKKERKRESVCVKV